MEMRDILPMWEYACPSCLTITSVKVEHCEHCGAVFDEQKWRIPPRKITTQKAILKELAKGFGVSIPELNTEQEIDRYVHQVLAPQLSPSGQEELFKFFTTYFTTQFDIGDFTEFTTSGGVTIVTDTVYKGTYACKMTPASTFNDAYLTKTLATARTTLFIRHYRMFNDISGIIVKVISYDPSYDQVAYLSITSTVLTLRDDVNAVNYTDNSITYTAGQWYCFEIQITVATASGVLKAWVDGVLKIDQTAINYSTVNTVIDVTINQRSEGTIYTNWVDCITIADAYIGTVAGNTPTGVVYQNKSENKVTSDATTLTLTAPAGFSSGDLFIAIVTKDGTGAITPPTGSTWTQIQASASAGNYVGVYYRIAQTGDTTWDWTGASEQWYGTILRYTGHDGSSPIYDSGISTGGPDTAPIAPSVNYTSLDAGCIALQLFGADDDDTPYTPPILLRFRGVSNTGSGTTGAEGAEKPVSGSGSTGTATFAMNAAEEWVAITVVISVASESTAKDVSDTGAGADALTTEGQPSITETGSGADSPALEATLPTISDSGGGSDTSSPEGQIGVLDYSIGDELVLMDLEQFFADTGVGEDLMPYIELLIEDRGAFKVYVNDAGLGDDVYASEGGISKELQELGSLADIVVVEIALTLTDIGIGEEISSFGPGGEVIILEAAIPALETGTDEEVPGMDGDLWIGENGAGLDEGGPMFEMIFTDEGIGAESLTAGLESIPIDVFDEGIGEDLLSEFERDLFDSAIGVENIPELDRSFDEEGEGIDITTFLTTLPVTDSGTGVDSPSASDVRGEMVTILADIPMTEVPVGIETFGLDGALSSSDEGIGSEEPLLGLEWLVTDEGIGSEEYIPESAENVDVVEEGVGVDELVEFEREIFDDAIGTDDLPEFEKTITDEAAGVDDITDMEIGILDDGIGEDIVVEKNIPIEDSAIGVDELIEFDRLFLDEVIGVDELSEFEREFQDTGIGEDFLPGSLQTTIDEGSAIESIETSTEFLRSDYGLGEDKISVSKGEVALMVGRIMRVGEKGYINEVGWKGLLEVVST